MTFGEKLKAARIFNKMTQRQLANLIGAKHNSISDWENNKNRPDSDMIESLCQILNISADYLINENSTDFSNEEQNLIKKYRALDDKGKETVNFIIDKEYNNLYPYYTDVTKARDFLESIDLLAAFNGQKNYSDDDVLQIANVICTMRYRSESR